MLIFYDSHKVAVNSHCTPNLWGGGSDQDAQDYMGRQELEKSELILAKPIYNRRCINEKVYNVLRALVKDVGDSVRKGAAGCGAYPKPWLDRLKEQLPEVELYESALGEITDALHCSLSAGKDDVSRIFSEILCDREFLNNSKCVYVGSNAYQPKYYYGLSGLLSNSKAFLVHPRGQADYAYLIPLDDKIVQSSSVSSFADTSLHPDRSVPAHSGEKSGWSRDSALVRSGASVIEV